VLATLRTDAARLRFSTSTLAAGEFVPWLASAGDLAYSPHSPPQKDYYFQYSWVIPGVFSEGVCRRRHFWFGGRLRDGAEVRLLFAFWIQVQVRQSGDPLPIERNGRGRRSKWAAGTLRWAHDSLNTIKFARIWSACVSRYAPRSVQRRLRSGVTWSSQPHKRHRAPRNLIRFKAPAGLESRL
jgi:hypothetical protein